MTDSGSPTSHAARASTINHIRRKSSLAGKVTSVGSGTGPEADNEELEDENEGADFGDDFDEFEEGDGDAEFGDFDGGFQKTEEVPVPPLQSLPTITPAFVSGPAVRNDMMQMCSL